MKVDNLIYELIEIEVVLVRGFNCWLACKYKIRDILNRLEPTIPEDGTTGFIAYNTSNTRMKMKTGRFLTRKLQLNSVLKDVFLHRIACNINSELFADDIEVNLVSGSKITAKYKEEWGGHSCMTEGNAYCTGLYEQNPDRFQMLAMKNINDTARAIVHKFDNGRYMMDRVYATCDDMKSKMVDYARKESWLVGYGHDPVDRDWIVSGLDYEEGRVPYMDTMIYYNLRGGKMDITADYRNNYEGELQNTDGSLDGGYSCCNCGECVSEDDSYCLEGGEIYCLDCYREYYHYCESCDTDAYRDNMVYISDRDIYVCEYCANSHFIQCRECGGYYGDDYVVTEDSETYCLDCADKLLVCCEGCSEWYDADCTTDGYCESCLPEEGEKPIPAIPVSCKISDTSELPFEGGI